MQRVAHMNVVQRLTLALKGGRSERMLLIRDPNKLIQRCVLQSPRLTDTEVEAFASMSSLPGETLRAISLTRLFMKNYSVVRNLTNNPKTPLDVSLHLFPRLTSTDLVNSRRIKMCRRPCGRRPEASPQAQAGKLGAPWRAGTYSEDRSRHGQRPQDRHGIFGGYQPARRRTAALGASLDLSKRRTLPPGRAWRRVRLHRRPWPLPGPGPLQRQVPDRHPTAYAR